MKRTSGLSIPMPSAWVEQTNLVLIGHELLLYILPGSIFSGPRDKYSAFHSLLLEKCCHHLRTALVAV